MTVSRISPWFRSLPVEASSALTQSSVGIHGYIAEITDGGATWNVQESGTERLLQGVDFADAEHGVAVGEKGTLLSTSDGGATWTAQSAGISLNDVACAGPDQWWVVGDEGVILRHD